MRRIIMALILTGIATASVSAQSMGTSYKTALGVKVWDGAGITLKHFTDASKAFEFIGYFYREGARITGLYEIHGPISGAPGLKWYIGPGAHVGFYDKKYGDKAFAGIDGVLGLDLKVKNAPLNFSIDWQPSFEFGDNRGFVGSWGGLGIRYTF
ncbi:MAG: hypothetical protein LH478_08990 [Chitinophagaceae bacterium]|nr:hypothetical protein [Chitinophagaceae bacterium]